ncbi:MAG: LytR/AlgR family response regulator transcription factor [Pyrinomonadaceae bacterium]
MKLRIVIADDERPARQFLKNLLADFEDAEIVGEAKNGAEAIEIIERSKPDLALLDLQMPEIGGLEVVKLLRKPALPLVAFVTAYDEFAVRAFEVGAVDYLLKPVEKQRLRETLNRAHERLEQTDFREREAKNLESAAAIYEQTAPRNFLERIPVRRREEIILLPVAEISSIVADGELLHLNTARGERCTINFRLKDLEARLDAAKFVRLSRGSLANLEMIQKISPMPGGTYLVTLKDGQELAASRLQSRILRERLLKI